MPRGTVIAIKPMGSKNDSELLHAVSSGSNQYHAYTTAKDPDAKQVVYYVRVDEPTANSDEIVWFIDDKNKYRKRQGLEFDINEGMTKAINGAVNVRKDKTNVPFIPQGILPQLALIAVALLIIGVTVDKKH